MSTDLDSSKTRGLSHNSGLSDNVPDKVASPTHSMGSKKQQPQQQQQQQSILPNTKLKHKTSTAGMNNNLAPMKSNSTTEMDSSTAPPTISQQSQKSVARSFASSPKTDEIHTQTQASPPPIPHVQINQVPLSLIIRNLTVFTVNEIGQYMKTNLHNDPETGLNNPSLKKVKFLQLIIYLRNQFLKLYVLIKWVKTIRKNNFHVLIDLLNWFRSANVSVNNCIWALKGSLTSMTNAKLPNADLVTALEVLSLGRPNLPIRYFQLLNSDIAEGSTTNNYYNIKIPPVLILRKLQDINLTISIKLSLMDLPVQFNNHYVKNGRVYITVPNEFEIQLSTIDMTSPFFFVDLNLFIYMNDSSLPLNKLKMEKLINEILYKNKDRNPFFLLYQFLHKYVLTIKLYLVHLELLALENTGKFSGGDMIHIYDSKKSIVTGRYWVRGKLGNRGKFTIGVDKASEKLILRWDNYFLADRASGPTGNANANVNMNAGATSLGSGLASASQLQRPMSDKAFSSTMSNNPSLLNIPAASSNPLIGSAINNALGGVTPSGAPGMSTPTLAVTATERAGAILNENRFKRMPFIYHNILGNLESILDEIMYNHATVIRSELLATGIFREDEESPDVLYFRISTTSLSSAPIYLKIDLISGVFYFKNPTPLLLGYTQRINRTEKMEDLIKIFHRLKLDRITQVLRNMFEKTGWICSKAIKLPNLIPTNIQLPSSTGNIPATNASGNSGVFGNGDLLQ